MSSGTARRQALGAYFQNARVAARLTQDVVGEAVGVGDQQVSRWERGAAFPSAKHLSVLQKLLDLEESELDRLLGEAKAEQARELQAENRSLQSERGQLVSSVKRIENALVQQGQQMEQHHQALKKILALLEERLQVG